MSGAVPRSAEVCRIGNPWAWLGREEGERERGRVGERACERARRGEGRGEGARVCGLGRHAGSANVVGEPHLAVSQALMLAMSSGSLEAEAGLHFQLPPTMGRRDISLLAEESDERSSVGVARSISGARDAQFRGATANC